MNWARVLKIQIISNTIFLHTLEAGNTRVLNPFQASVPRNELK